MKRIYSVKNKQAFPESIAQTDWSEIYSVIGTDIAFNAFHKKLAGMLNIFPQIRVKRNIIIENLGYHKPCVHQLSIRIKCIIGTEKLIQLKVKFYTYKANLT